MDLSLATVLDCAPTGCQVQPLDAPAPLFAHYSRLVVGRIRIQPGQLVALDRSGGAPEIVWRWFRGPVRMLADGFAVVDYRPYQAGSRCPLGVVRVPEHLLAAVAVGDEIFYNHAHDSSEGAIAAVVVDGRPADPGRIAADLFPAIEQVYAEAGGA